MEFFTHNSIEDLRMIRSAQKDRDDRRYKFLILMENLYSTANFELLRIWTNETTYLQRLTKIRSFTSTSQRLRQSIYLNKDQMIGLLIETETYRRTTSTKSSLLSSQFIVPRPCASKSFAEA